MGCEFWLSAPFRKSASLRFCHTMRNNRWEHCISPSGTRSATFICVGTAKSVCTQRDVIDHSLSFAGYSQQAHWLDSLWSPMKEFSLPHRMPPSEAIANAACLPGLYSNVQNFASRAIFQQVLLILVVYRYTMGPSTQKEAHCRRAHQRHLAASTSTASFINQRHRTWECFTFEQACKNWESSCKV